ncbi:hypothetical protein ABH940_000110 [Streptacidiphilus sp. BW17]|uniref:hypothetical protein n=1 Tax=Streptacidiphilus sp. BW17 TaxID=3156274 RepID=UPI0035124B83
MPRIQDTETESSDVGADKVRWAGFRAFVQLYEGDFLLYAHARLRDPLASRVAVDQALRRTEQGWRAIVRQRCPNASVWLVLRAAVDRARSSAGVSVDLPASGLPDVVADAALLHHQLGMSMSRVAELMGTEVSEIQASLLVIQRLAEAPTVTTAGEGASQSGLSLGT